jgi:lysophospholipase
MKESEIERGFFDTVLPWIESNGRRVSLVGTGGVTLRALCLEHPAEKAAVVFVCGHYESFLKYGELYRQLHEHGQSIYCCDHRGQGFSDHLLPDPGIAHVARWEDWVADLGLFMDGVVTARPHERIFVIAHSLGGAIASVFMARRHPPLRGAILSAPLVRNRFPVSARMGVRVMAGIGKGNERIPGGRPYAPISFAENRETRSPARHAVKAAIIERYPEIRFGDPSSRYVVEMMRVAAAARASAGALALPVLVLKPGDDAYVDPDALDAFCAALPNGRKVFFEGARHEVLIEVDGVRDRAVAEILSFIDAH